MNVTQNETAVEIAIIIGFGSLYFLGLILEVLCAILFIYHIAIKKTIYFCTGFFYILTFGFAFDMASIVMVLLGALTAEDSHHAMIMNIGMYFYWYSMMLLGPWNTLMALNRFTAVWFWKRHDAIWSWKLILGGIIAMFLYPFFSSIHLLAEDSYCYFHPNDAKSCQIFSATAVFLATISNGVHVIIAAALGIITAFASRCEIIAVTSETKKFEQFLLIQSILSLLLYGCHLYQTLTAFNDTEERNTIFRRVIDNLSETYYTFFRISSALLLFFLSKTMRLSFIRFYLNWILKYFFKNKVNGEDGSRIQVITRTSISVIKIT